LPIVDTLQFDSAATPKSNNIKALNRLELERWKHCYFWAYQDAQHRLLLNDNNNDDDDDDDDVTSWRFIDRAALCLQLSLDARGSSRLGPISPQPFVPHWLELCANVNATTNNDDDDDDEIDIESNADIEEQLAVSMDLSFRDGSWQHNIDIVFNWTSSNDDNSSLQRGCVRVHIAQPIRSLQLSLTAMHNDVTPSNARLASFSNISLQSFINHTSSTIVCL
jgi:hypothetical protein